MAPYERGVVRKKYRPTYANPKNVGGFGETCRYARGGYILVSPFDHPSALRAVRAPFPPRDSPRMRLRDNARDKERGGKEGVGAESRSKA